MYVADDFFMIRILVLQHQWKKRVNSMGIYVEK